jgi:serine/threonine-protein kinase
LVLEYLAGGTLADRIRHGPLPGSDVLTIFTAIADVLQHIHNAGYLHRDIKPSNLGFTFYGAPKMLDFGLLQLIEGVSEGSTAGSVTAGAVSVQRAADGDATHAGDASGSAIRQFIGTPAYMSPEAIAMEPPGPLVDLWSLAVTMYESLTGTNPFRAPSMPETIKLVMLGMVPDARTVRADCPPLLAQFLMTALARNRHHRPQTAADFLRAMQTMRT